MHGEIMSDKDDRLSETPVDETLSDEELGDMCVRWCRLTVQIIAHFQEVIQWARD